jgi:excisionase family DNA binding protein
MTAPQSQTTSQAPTGGSQRVLLTVEQAAETIGIGRTTTYSMVKSGELKSVKVGRLRRIPLDEVHALMARLMAEQNAANTTEGN